MLHQRVQSWALLLLAILQPIAGRLAQMTGCGASIGERARAARGTVQPANGAFAIWRPLFAGSLALARRSFSRPRYGTPVDSWIAWLGGVALAGNSSWSLQVQFAGLGWRSFAIISTSAAAANAATIVASRARTPSRFARFAAHTLGPLAGWLTVATFANLDSTLIATRGRISGRASDMQSLALLGAATGAASAMAVATRGNAGHAGAAAWGLAGIVLRNRRESRPAVATCAALGLGAVALATILARRHLRQ